MPKPDSITTQSDSAQPQHLPIANSPNHLYAATAFLAISSTPWYVALPPMKPLACTNTQPGMPHTADRASSLRPFQASGMLLRCSKDAAAGGTHCRTATAAAA